MKSMALIRSQKHAIQGLNSGHSLPCVLSPLFLFSPFAREQEKNAPGH